MKNLLKVMIYGLISWISLNSIGIATAQHNITIEVDKIGLTKAKNFETIYDNWAPFDKTNYEYKGCTDTIRTWELWYVYFYKNALPYYYNAVYYYRFTLQIIDGKWKYVYFGSNWASSDYNQNTLNYYLKSTNQSSCFPQQQECTSNNFTNQNDMLCEENVHNPDANITINGKRREY